MSNLDDFRADVRAAFGKMDGHLEAVDARLESVDRRLEAVDRRLEAIDARFDAVDAQFQAVDGRFQAVDDRFAEVVRGIAADGERTRQYVAEESARTRRHFDIRVEQILAERNLVLDQSSAVERRPIQLTATNAAAHTGFERQLDDHESRLRRLEEAAESDAKADSES
jgi:chromosome segregation ATPase